MAIDETVDAYEALLVALEPRRALLTLSHAVRTHRLRAAGKDLAPASHAFRVFRREDSE